MTDYDKALQALEDMERNLETLDRIFRSADRMTYERWKSYPRAHIAMALSKDHDYVGNDMFTVKELIKDLDGANKDDDCEYCGATASCDATCECPDCEEANRV